MKLESRFLDLKHLDELAAANSVIHKINPCVKLLTTIIYIIIVASFPKYNPLDLIPMFVYPIAIIQAAKLPPFFLLKRLLMLSPLVIVMGIFNPFIDQTPLMQAGGYIVTGGWISFTSIILRFILTVTGALLLIATTGIDAICLAMLKLKVPRILVFQLLFTYRYIYVLLDESARIIRAHSLRAVYGSQLEYKVWGSLLGQLAIRTLDRAQRIYQAMLCRGFTGEIRVNRNISVNHWDIAYLLGWSVLFFCIRFLNLPQYIGIILTGGIR